jgi:hypothetical protein
MKAPWLSIGGIEVKQPQRAGGAQHVEAVVLHRRPDGVSSVRHSGSSASKPADDHRAGRMWAPTSEPFSTTTTEMSAEICFSRIAAESPAGPAPTTTSNSIDCGRAIHRSSDHPANGREAVRRIYPIFVRRDTPA